MPILTHMLPRIPDSLRWGSVSADTRFKSERLTDGLLSSTVHKRFHWLRIDLNRDAERIIEQA